MPDLPMDNGAARDREDEAGDAIGTILPPRCFEEALECTKIQSMSDLIPANAALLTMRLFR
jgi:hypothetical protein